LIFTSDKIGRDQSHFNLSHKSTDKKNKILFNLSGILVLEIINITSLIVMSFILIGHTYLVPGVRFKEEVLLMKLESNHIRH